MKCTGFALLTILTCTAFPAMALDVNSLGPIAAEDSLAPHLAVTMDQTVVMNWLEPAAEGHALRFAILGDERWQSPRTVASGSNWFVNWADFPSVVPINENFWVAHWLASQPAGGYAYDVAVAVSNDAGVTWSTPFLANDDSTATEHGFVSIFPYQDKAGLIWLDGRNMTGGHSGHEGSEGMTLRSALVNHQSDLLQPRQVDDLVCDCCQTDIAVSDDGPVAVYRNRTQEEVRDIHYARLIDGEWASGGAVHDDGWNISGCPVNGPAIAARGNQLAVAWYTGANEQSIVRLAFSNEASEGFEPAIDIDDVSPLGGVDVLLLDNGDAVVSWLTDLPDGQAMLAVQRVSASGETGERRRVALSSAGRMTGFPQMVASGDRIVLAWTDRVDERKTVKTAWVAVTDI